jgi:hypothetical protein
VNEGQIVPMKEHTSNSAMLDSTHQMIPFSTFTFFVTGNFSSAVQAGQDYFGMTGNWSRVNVHTYQTINHQVEPALNALQCGECHAAYAGGAPTRMDLQGSLGYAPKQPLSQTCSQCHSVEDNPGFVSVHNRHLVEGITCDSCHNFSRPERTAVAIGNDTIGTYRNGVFYLRNSNTNGIADLVFGYGNTAGDIPIIGDWNGDGTDTVGIYRNGMFFLRNSNTNGIADLVFGYGNTAGDIPIIGDWNGDGTDTVGIYRNGMFFLRNSNTNGIADLVFGYGLSTDTPLIGDWDGS